MVFRFGIKITNNVFPPPTSKCKNLKTSPPPKYNVNKQKIGLPLPQTLTPCHPKYTYRCKPRGGGNTGNRWGFSEKSIPWVGDLIKYTCLGYGTFDCFSRETVNFDLTKVDSHFPMSPSP